MKLTNFALTMGFRPTAKSGLAPRTARRGALRCEWIATGDPRRPLACVWTDASESESNPVSESAAGPHRGLFLVRA
jgi:hypothetical protein